MFKTTFYLYADQAPNFNISWFLINYNLGFDLYAQYCADAMLACAATGNKRRRSWFVYLQVDDLQRHVCVDVCVCVCVCRNWLRGV